MINTFTLSFIQQHQEAFDEYLSLGTLISQNNIEGIESPKEYDKVFKLQQVLKARRSTDLTAKEAEALDGCLGQMSESQYIPSLDAVVDLETGFMLYMDGAKMKYMDGALKKYVD
jgi:hypothetical protein